MCKSTCTIHTVYKLIYKKFTSCSRISTAANENNGKNVVQQQLKLLQTNATLRTHTRTVKYKNERRDDEKYIQIYMYKKENGSI